MKWLDDNESKWIEFVTGESAPDSTPDTPEDSHWAEAAEKEHDEYWKQYKSRDALYTEMLQQYLNVHKSKANHNKVYKGIFFVVTMLILLVLIGAPMAAMILIAMKDQVKLADIALVVSGLGGIITSIIVLPKIIAEHLFPTDEDQNMIELVKKMQDNDAQIRSAFHPDDHDQTKK